MADEMFCACPYCDAVFRLPVEKMGQYASMVRCGACREVFYSNTNLVQRSEHGFVPYPKAQLSSEENDNRIYEQSKQQQVNQEQQLQNQTVETNQFIKDDQKANEELSDSPSTEPMQDEISGQIPGIEISCRDDDFYEQNTLSTDQPGADEKSGDLDRYSEQSLNTRSSHTDNVLDRVFEQFEPKEIEIRSPFHDPFNDAPEENSEFTDPDESINFGIHSDLQADSDYSENDEFTLHHKDQEDLDHSELSGIDLEKIAEGRQPDFNATLNASTLSAGIKDTPLGRMNRNGVDEYISNRANPFVSFSWMMVTLIFVFLFGMQVKYFFVERYAQHEDYRKYLVGFCKIARCELPPRQDPFRFTLTHTQIDLHPGQPGALRITVKLVNEAKFAQPYPLLQLTLTDRVGRVVGRRTFTPDSYLSENDRNMLGQGELASVLFDLARPHEKAVGFVVDIVTNPVSS